MACKQIDIDRKIRNQNELNDESKEEKTNKRKIQTIKIAPRSHEHTLKLRRKKTLKLV